MNRWRERIRASVRPGRDWYRIANAGGDTASVYLYDEIGWFGTTAQGFADVLNAITTPRIDLHINSPGGDVFDGLAIHSCLRNHPARVTTYVDGLAASAASFIALAGDRVVMARNAIMMIHDAWGLAIGNAADMRQLADLLDKLSDNIADIYARRTGGTVAQWREQMLAETWYTGAEAVAAGLADETTDPDPALDDAMTATDRWDLSIFTYAGRDKAPGPARPPVNPAAAGVSASAAPAVSEPSPPGEHGDSLAPAATPPDEPAAEPVEQAVVDEDQVEQPPAVPAAEPAPDGPAGPPLAGRTVDLPGDDDWAEWAMLVHDLLAPSTVDDALARLREATA